MLVEVIACSLVDAAIAKDAGADRIELCLAIEVGGLTPYLETVRNMESIAPLPAVVMVRPQPGGVVSQNKQKLEQIEDILNLGLTNIQIITGALTENKTLDLVAMKAIRDRTPGTVLACHRCFDLTPDPFVALEQLIDLGFNRVLTSGQAQTALEGADVIRKLHQQANGRIEIVAGSGVRPHNVQELITRTGVTQVHASCFADTDQSNSKVDFGPTLTVSSEKVRSLVKAAKP